MTSPPSDTFTFDLKNGDLFVGNSKELKAQLPGHVSDIKLTIKDISTVEGLSRTRSDGGVDQFAYSPVVILTINGKITTQFSDGPFTSTTDAGQTILEGEPTHIVDVSLNADGRTVDGSAETSGDFFDYSNCVFQTELQPNYQP